MLSKKNKRGFVDQLVIMLVIVVILIVMILIFWAGSSILPVIAGTGNQVVDQLKSSTQASQPNTDIANITRDTGNTVSGILGVGETLVYIVFFMGILGFFAMAYYVRSYPFLAFFWVFIVVVLVFISMFVSNAYTVASTQPATASFYSAWGSNDFLMSNLPSIVAVVGVFGGIFLFILASRDPESEAQTL